MTKRKNKTTFCHTVGHIFCLKFILISQILERFCNFLQISPFNFQNLGLSIKILVYPNEEYAIVTISANNLVLWLKLRTNEAKKISKTCQKMRKQLLGNFTKSFSTAYIEIAVHIDLGQISCSLIRILLKIGYWLM